MTEQLNNFLSFWEGKKFKKIIEHNIRKINEGGISSTAPSLTDTVNKMLHRLMNATLPLSFNLFVIGSKNTVSK